MTGPLAGLHPVVLHHILNSLGWPDLRPLQHAAIGPLLRGDDALLLAETAAGKTEAVAFPLLSRMAHEDWRGLSVLVLCPLRALLNNLEPRLAAYSGWLGRRTALWHGDVPAGARRQIVADLPDLLLTTPESLEAMLVSARLPHREVFAGLRAVVVDEVHAFAGDDRGWHLLALLERLTRLAGRPLQRIGLSATVGNPAELLGWLRGPGGADRPGSSVVRAPAPGAVTADLQLDYVASLPNAATVVAALHRGEKRLVFSESRRVAEAMTAALRDGGVEAYVSHSSLALDARRRAEEAFAQGRDCVIVATSTLELGVDVGDLDRVIQVGAPRTVASLLQRLGRTGRRPGTSRNTLFLATSDEELLQAAALLTLWGEGYVEPVQPPRTPRHLLAQQLLGLCLQEGAVGDTDWMDWLGGLPLGDPEDADVVADWLLDTAHLDRDTGMLFVGPEAQRRWGRRHFLELLAVFTAAPQLRVLHGRNEVGTVDLLSVTQPVTGPRVLALAGGSWLVRHIDWTRRQIFVEPSRQAGRSRWSGVGGALSYPVTDAMRRVLGARPAGAGLSRRAVARLDWLDEDQAPLVAAEASVIAAAGPGPARWWTWGGGRANAVLAAALEQSAPGVLAAGDRIDDRYLRLSEGATAGDVRRGLEAARLRFGARLDSVVPAVSDEAVRALKFAELLPPDLARRTLAARLADHAGAAAIASRGLLDGR